MNVFSMFDGVGGFILGLEKSDLEFYKTIYANQYEPSRKSQDAHEVGVFQYPEIEHINIDVALIPDKRFIEMRRNGVEMIVGGFPCQDYSVARSKRHELGIEGKKGVLFWEIIRAVTHIRPKYLVLENVDRLLKSPSKQRGRDFAVMLAAFNNLGYSVEWRVINAADYGRAQRRRRVFFFIFRNDTGWGKYIDKTYEHTFQNNHEDAQKYNKYIFKEGLFAKQFPIKQKPYKNRSSSGRVQKDIVKVSDLYEGGAFWNTGIMRHGNFYAVDSVPTLDEKPIPLKDIILPMHEVPERYFITEAQLEKFRYLRGPKRLERTSNQGYTYMYAEGGMSPYDSLDLPARTMLTSEGTINRSTHLLCIDGRYRLLTPIEAERLQDFPDDWTRYKKTINGETKQVSDRMRMFFMGNALVTDIVRRIGDGIKEIDLQYS